MTSATVPKRQLLAERLPSVDWRIGDHPGERSRWQANGEIDARHIEVARRLYHERRRRDAAMGAHRSFFGEPCWDILLDLFVSVGVGRPVSISSACLSAGVPQSTALRYVGELEKGGFLTRSPDPLDARRRYLTLTELGIRMMRNYLEGLR